MRRALAVISSIAFGLGAVGLAACAGGADRGPRWPRAHAAEDDGGESLAPHPGAHSVSAVERSAAADADDDDTAADKPAAASTPSSASSTPAASTPATEDPIMLDDLVIEVDD